jgi:hypothetical protein
VNRDGPPTRPDGSPGAYIHVSEQIRHLAYAEASLMLVECLMLTLVEHRILTTAEIVDAVETAIATKRQMIDDREHPDIAAVAAGILSTLANSLAAGKS